MVFWFLLFFSSFFPAQAYEYGIDRLEEPGIQQMLEGRRIGVLAHAASVDRNGNHLIDLLNTHPERTKLVKIFVPEHGLRSQNDGWIENGTDEKTGLPVISLYKKESRAPNPNDLKDLDLIVVDLQDVGVRYYTYFSTIAEFLKVAASLRKEILLLDRPNPLGGITVEGETLDPSLAEKFISYFTVPTRHGMTLGELARLWVAERKLDLPLSVIEVKGWNRESTILHPDRNWVPSSPALLSAEQVLLYALWGTLEQFNLAVGRGMQNDLAFRVIAAPWIAPTEAEALAAELNAEGFPGVVFIPHSYTATRAIYEGIQVNGVRVEFTDFDDTIRTDEFTYQISSLLLKRFSTRLQFSKVAPNYYGSQAWVDGLKNGADWNSMAEKTNAGIEKFQERRKPYLLY